MDHPPKPPVVLSFCPGILGLERGIERAIGKLDVAAYMEIEAVIQANLVAGMEAGLLDPAPIWTDVKTFDARPFRGKIHGLIGGYPCPGESFAGLREGHLYHGFLWPYIRRAFKASQPLWGFFENVEGHLSGTYPIVYRSLQNMGYAAEAGIFSAEEVGAPQQRKRTFILAVAKPYLYDVRRRFRDQQKKGCTNESEAPWKNWQWLRNEFGHLDQTMGHAQCIGRKGGICAQQSTCSALQSNHKMGNANIQGLQRNERERFGSSFEAFVKKSSGCSDRELWPKGQGYEQWPWEEPRQVEPQVEFTIDGYNFYSDLVRAVGNSVVEQTAELAWITLWNKIINQ
ncbi:MAG: DNA cytosine methyltransferase [Fulvivirga sp.]